MRHATGSGFPSAPIGLIMGMPAHPRKISFEEMRESGVRGLLGLQRLPLQPLGADRLGDLRQINAVVMCFAVLSNGICCSQQVKGWSDAQAIGGTNHDDAQDCFPVRIGWRVRYDSREYPGHIGGGGLPA